MTEQASVVDLLSVSNLFAGIAPATLRDLAAFAVLRNYEEGDSIYSLGAEATEVFVVEHGRVRFSIGVGNRPGAAGSIMTRGDVFGWAALLEGPQRRVATASCLEDVTVAALDASRLHEVFEADPAAGYLVMKRIAAMIAGNLLDALTT